MVFLSGHIAGLGITRYWIVDWKRLVILPCLARRRIRRNLTRISWFDLRSSTQGVEFPMAGQSNPLLLENHTPSPNKQCGDLFVSFSPPKRECRIGGMGEGQVSPTGRNDIAGNWCSRKRSSPSSSVAGLILPRIRLADMLRPCPKILFPYSWDNWNRPGIYHIYPL